MRSMHFKTLQPAWNATPMFPVFIPICIPNSRGFVSSKPEPQTPSHHTIVPITAPLSRGGRNHSNCFDDFYLNN